MSRKVIVTDICASASEKTVKDFFLFCGKIKEFELVKDESSDKQMAYVTFERESAAKTALMLSNALIGKSHITVKSADDTSSGADESTDGDSNGLNQEDKPKTAIFSEILAAGYQLQGHIIQKGIEFDATYGLSSRVKQYLVQLQTNLKSLDEKYKVIETVTAKAAEIDNKYAVQTKVKYAASQAQDKANQALQTSTGQRLTDFYLSTTKSIADVYAEARRIADEKNTTRDSPEAIEAH